MDTSERSERNRDGDVEETAAPRQASRARVHTGPDDHDDTFRNGDYTVGWVCALPIELAAAKAMLDRIHKPLLSVRGDGNAYTLGNIGLHNVVIACLPMDHYGNNNAANVAANMSRSFPSIDKRFLVGIGGGIPTEDKDIRLGDVVVGIEVIQYDLGKQKPYGIFERTAKVIGAPQTLQMAASNLRASHEMGASRITSLLSDMAQRYPAMRSYTEPTHPDRLFYSTYNHNTSQNSCDSCSEAQIVQRDPRMQESPYVHYGRIGSADQVMKDGQKRDQLAEELKIVCVEMEAAGLMDSFPSLCIRGICDYADSHKTKEWQKYAAAVAAAYTKELLLEMPGLRPPLYRTRPEASKHAPMSLREARNRLLESLDFEQIESRQANIKTAYARTCRWFFLNRNFQQWLDPSQLSQHHGFLWIIGKPGAGKSTVMKFTYNHVRETSDSGSMAIAFFFNARGTVLEKSTLGMYRSLLSQIFEHAPELAYILDKYTSKLQKYSASFKWTVEILQTILSEIVTNLGTLGLTLFIDALDECDAEQIRDMVEYFEELGESALENNTRLYICFSSRPYPHVDIRNRIRFTLEEQPDHGQDLARYVQGKLRAGDSPLAHWVYDEVLRKSAGVFMWVVLVVDILNGVFRNGQLLQVKRRLQELPAKLSELFKDILCRDEENMDGLLLCIQWIAFAARPLTCAEYYFAHAIGLYCSESSEIEPATIEWDHTNITSEVMRRYIVSSSKGLAEITTSRKIDTVNFIHESVRDFLLKDDGIRQLWPHLPDNFEAQSHERLKLCCHGYISIEKPLLQQLPRGPVKHRQSKTLNSFPFLEYAAKYMFHHADQATIATSQSMFLSQVSFDSWATQYDLFHPFEGIRLGHYMSLLNALVDINCPHLVRSLIPSHSGFKRYGKFYPLFIAMDRGSLEMVTLFLGHEAKISSHDFIKRQQFYFKYSNKRDDHPTPLHWAVNTGEIGLIAHAIDMEPGDLNEQNSKGHTPLLAAVKIGRDDIVQLLLETPGILPHVQCSARRSPLWYACANGQLAIAKLLLAISVEDVDLGDHERRTPLSQAAENGHSAIVDVLLQTARVDLNSRCKYHRTPLTYAAIGGHFSIMKQLALFDGLDLEPVDLWSQTPFLYASLHGHTIIMFSLLATGKVDVNQKGSFNRSPLCLAVLGGYVEAVRLLLAIPNIEVDPKDSFWRTPLSYAAESGHIGVARLLIATRSIDINSKCMDAWTPFVYAVHKNRTKVVRLLISTGQVKPYSPPMSISLMILSDSDPGGLLELLLDYQKTFDNEDKAGDALLQFIKDWRFAVRELPSRRSDYEKIVRALLVQKERDDEVKLRMRTNPLGALSGSG